ncbi:D-sedoheptulose-7-phosphate isomerase [Reinekea thalattae]|uniref:SIS domain-containing protein n=1 Tax=Reinekea thalattae TaxID=2593301 RepID=A0A5C8Z501_9GAMM|nr:SIS domain-containing protein [Reinekea thalattae]TXR51986.1 SIS domain-containing protein [Reinekea thalattae]
MNPQNLIVEHIGQSLETFQMAAETLSDLMIHASDVMTECLLNDGKIAVCGMGVSGATAASFAVRMLSRFERERPGLPAIVLNSDGLMTSAISNFNGPADIYAHQIHSLCNERDILLLVSSTGTASALIKAIQAAHDQGTTVIALTGGTGGDVATLLADNDIELRIESERIGPVQLSHHLLLNCLVELIENTIFGSDL